MRYRWAGRGEWLLALSLVGVVVALAPASASAAPPVFVLPPQGGDVEANDPAGHVGPIYSIAYYDPDGDSLFAACNPDSSATFPFGPTNVHCYVTDGDETTTHDFTLNIVDTTPPDILANDLTVEATGAQTTVTYAPPAATDIVGVTATPSCTPASGFSGALGSHTVTCTVADIKGNSATESFSIDVVDTTPPEISVPVATTEAIGPAGAAVSFDAPTAVDLVDGERAVDCSHGSGETFPIGVTAVECTSADLSGNIGRANFAVTVTDSTGPTVTPPADQTVEATGPDGAVVTHGGATASDTVDPFVTAACAPASGSTFPLGQTMVTCTATDDHGNVGSATFTVAVVDTTPPVLTTGGDITATATGPDGAAVSFNPTAADTVDGSVDVDCTASSGSTFAVGATTVTCTAADAAGNSTSESFTVLVLDRAVPLLHLPTNLTAEATGPTGAAVDFAPTATDDTDAAPDIRCIPASGTVFALGTTDVSCTAVDASGNASRAGFTVTVVDTSGPELSLPSDLTVSATGLDGAEVVYDASAIDAVVGDVPIRCVPPSGSVFPLGPTTVTCTASDAPPSIARNFGRGRLVTQVDPDTGNVTTGSFTVTVEVPPSTEPPPPPITTDPSAPASTDSTAPASTDSSSTTDAPGPGGSSTTIATSGDAGGAQLPATGTRSGAIAAVAGALLLCGCGVLVIAAVRWRRT